MEFNVMETKLSMYQPAIICALILFLKAQCGWISFDQEQALMFCSIYFTVPWSCVVLE